MKRLLVALMAVTMVLVAVSFAAAQSASSTASITAFQTVVPPGTAFGSITGPLGNISFSTSASNAFPFQTFNPSVTGAASGAASYEADAGGGGMQSAHLSSNGVRYHVTQSGGAHASVSGASL